MVIVRRWLIGLLSGLVAHVCVFAQLHSSHSSRALRLAASAAFDADGALWAVSVDGGYVMSRRSVDFGKRWLGPQRVNNTPEPIGAEGDARPKIAIGKTGEIYVTWTKPLSKPYTGEIRFSRSLDGGKTFSPPLTVHADRQEITHRFDAITVNKEGKIFLAWIDKRDQVKQGNTYRGAALYYAVSEDKGASFKGDYKAADHSCECCRIALLPRDDGGVLALWRHVFEPNVRDHALVRLNADGRSGVMRRATFDEWAVDICPHHGPSLAADGAGRLHAVWFTQGAKRSGVFYGRLGEGRVDALRAVGGEAAAHSDLAAYQQRVVVAWKEFNGTHTRLRAMASGNAGESWRERELARTDEASDQPRVLVYGGRFFVYWNTQRKAHRVLEVTL